jgi:dipeptidyl aminopeptidase/acylaminoacyl peptidase
MGFIARASAVFSLFLAAAGSAATPPPIEDFARMPAIDQVSISPDGHYLSSISELNGQHVLVVVDRVKGGAPKAIFAVKQTENFDMRWCGWANATRLLCGFIGSVTEDAPGTTTLTHLKIEKIHYATTRLVGVNADGSNVKVLVQNSYAGYSQFQDRILDWTPSEPDSVLVELDDDADTFPSVFELDVNTGKLKLRLSGNPPIRSFYSDARGEIRFGSGYTASDTRVGYFARLVGEKDWKPLNIGELKAFDSVQPLRVVPGKNRLLAVAESQGRRGLWEIDLEDKVAPKLLFENAQLDVDEPIESSDGRVLGVYYEDDHPHSYYTDKRAKSVIDGTNQFLPDTFNSIADVTADEKVYVLRSKNDIDFSSYALLDVGSGKGELEPLGVAYPELAKQPLGRMKSIEYAARDGVKVHGYLTLPPGVQDAKNLPLIVMPHGGPIARDSWDFDFLRLFLASRGYAVLQMNFRGSDGFGYEWLHAAHQDWGGVTYDDIVDGARWAITEKIADPKRMGIVGWSFGGYAAMLGAVRNGDLFRCAASIAGVSDLIQLEDDGRNFTNERLVREQIGMNRQKLLADSPLRHASEVKVPVLLVHGADDWTVLVEHSKRMASELSSAKKPYELIVIPKADHQLRWRSERITLLTALEKFLASNLGN